MEQLATTEKRVWTKDINSNQWHTLVAGTLGWGLDAFDQTIYSFTIISLIAEWNITTVETGVAATAMMAASAVGGVLFGWLSDRIGRMKVLTITILMYGCLTGVCALSTNIWMLVAFRALTGLGLGGEWSAGSALISETFPAEHRGKALGIMQAGYAIGGILAAAFGGMIVENFGWRWIFVVGALPAFLVFYVRRNVPESQVWLDYQAKKKAGIVDQEEKPKAKLGAIYIPKIIVGILFASFICSYSWPMGTFMATYLATPVDGGGAGQTITHASQLQISLFVGALIGYIVFGYVADKIGRKKTFIIWMIPAIVVSMCQVYFATISLTLYIVFAFLNGIFGTGMIAGFGPILNEMFPTNLRGFAAGLCYNSGRGVASAMVTFVGYMFLFYPMRVVLMACPLLIIGAMIMMIFIRESKGIDVSKI